MRERERNKNISFFSHVRNRNIGEGKLATGNMYMQLYGIELFPRLCLLVVVVLFSMNFIFFLWSGERLNIAEDSSFLSTNIFFYRSTISTYRRVMECVVEWGIRLCHMWDCLNFSSVEFLLKFTYIISDWAYLRNSRFSNQKYHQKEIIKHIQLRTHN